MKYGLTAAEQRLLDYIVAEHAAKHPSPSYEQMRAHMGYASKSRIHRIVVSLATRGHIVRIPNKKRSVAPVEERACPHCGLHATQDPTHAVLMDALRSVAARVGARVQ